MKIFYVCEKIKKLIFTDAFDHECRNDTTKFIHFLYCLCGGFCFDRKARKGFRKFFIAFNALCFLFMFLSCFHYWFSAPIKDYYQLLVPVPVASGKLVSFGMYVWIFYAKDMFLELIAILDNEEITRVIELSKSTPHSRHENPKSLSGVDYSKKYPSVVYVSTAMVIIIAFLVVGASIVNLEEYIKVDDYVIYSYPTYVPWNYPTIRMIVQILQVVTILPQIFTFPSFAAFIFIITIRMYERFEVLCLFLRDASRSLDQSMDEISKLELAMEEKYVPSSLSKIQELKIKRTLAADEFIRKFITIIKHHQQLYSVTKLYADKARPMMTLSYLGVHTVTIATSFIVCMIMVQKEFYWSLSVIPCACASLLIWLLLCAMGEVIHTMNEILAAEIYDSPWYLLEAKDRRLVHAFLTIIQRPIAIVACKLLPLRLSLFPEVLDSVYSQVQVLRTLQSNKQKNRN